MRFAPLSLAFLFLFAANSCRDTPLNPAGRPPDPSTGLSAINNIPWKLVAAKLADTSVNLGYYRDNPFRLVLKENSIAGHDGCTRYRGTYAMSGTTMHISCGIVGKAAGCPVRNGSPILRHVHLTGDWSVKYTSSSLVLTGSHTMLRFERMEEGHASP